MNLFNKPIIFVGDRPSKRNTDPKIAFAGTASEKRLFDWIIELDIFTYQAVNAYQLNGRADIDSWIHLRKHMLTPIVALGNNAAKALDLLKIPHFKLPHPSGRNRKLNDKNYIAEELKKCKEWLRENHRMA